MNEEHRNTLQANLHHICRDLDAEDVLPYLCAKGIIREEQAEELLKISRKSMRNMQLITIIKAAGPLAFQEFISALQFCDKKHLVELLLGHPSPITQQLTLPELTNAQQALKEMYLTRFQKVYPFSLPFTFDIENTWVSLALKEYKKQLDAAGYFTHRPQRPLRAQEDDMKHSQATEDHARLLKKAFDKVKMLIIEGDPATGKTSLMRRLAYEWAKGKQELLHYDLVLYTEFREVRDKMFESIADLVLGGLKKYLTKEGYDGLKKLMKNEQFCKEYHILVLLDGYDESSLGKQCSEFSSYMKEKTINKQLFFHTVITTRKGYLSNLRGREGRFVFAEVLGFTTMRQKETYISKHFLSSEIDNKENIAAVHSLMNNNENMNKLAETPLFLTFICLVHERIVDGTLVELYCNIIRWLIDRHQQDFPDRDIPALFGFRSEFEQASEPLNGRQKQNVIQKHCLQFSQLLSLSKMALNHLKKDIFQDVDFTEFNIKPIVHHVGLIRKDEFYDQLWNLTTTYCFPHRTIQEFLAALYCFCSDDPTSEWLLPNSTLDTSEKSDKNTKGMNEFERFLFRIVLSGKMPLLAEKRIFYLEKITVIKLDITFDAFNATSGFNSKLLNWFLSQCTNVQEIQLKGIMNRTKYASTHDTHVYNESGNRSKMTSPTLFSFSDLIKLHLLTFSECTFSVNCQLSFTNCPSLKKLEFWNCEMRSGSYLDIARLLAVDVVIYSKCTFKANSQLSFTNCKPLKILRFQWCFMERSTIVGIATLPAIDTVQFYWGRIDLATWQSITDQISNSTIKYFKLTLGDDFNKKFLVHLQTCNVEQMEITIQNYKIQNDLLSFSDLIKLHSLTFSECTFSAYSRLLFTNCPSLKQLGFSGCEMKSSTFVGIATLPAIDTVQFLKCTINLATWPSITDQINNSNVKYLHLSADFFVKESYPQVLHHFQKCGRIQQITVKEPWNDNNFLKRNEEEMTANLALTAQKLSALTSIIISGILGSPLDESRRLSERNRERIEKAGQQRNPHFSFKYVEEPELEE